jgi:predicted polyphosphate/ATP-dependent NAD kinase
MVEITSITGIGKSMHCKSTMQGMDILTEKQRIIKNCNCSPMRKAQAKLACVSKCEIPDSYLLTGLSQVKHSRD